MDNKKIHLLSVISFMDLFAVGLNVPLFANHVRSLGGSHFVLGLLSSTYSFIQLFSGPLIGSWSDIRGRKFVLIITLIISSLCYFVIGITSSLYVLFIIRITLGFTKHTQTLCKAFIADIVPKENQSTVYGFSTSVSMIGFIVGPIIGGHLSELKNGYFYVCSITSILFIVNIVLTNILPTTKIDKKKENISFSKELVKVVTDLAKVNWKSYWSIFSTKFLHGLAISIYFYNCTMLLKEDYGINQKIVGYIIAFQGSVGTISGFLTGWINKTFYKKDKTHNKKYFYGFIVITISFILLCMASNIYTFLLCLVPLATANTFLRIVETEILLTKSKNDKGSLTGTSNSLMSLARLIAPLCSGLIGDAWGQSYAICLAAVLSSGGTVIAGLQYSLVKRKIS